MDKFVKILGRYIADKTETPSRNRWKNIGSMKDKMREMKELHITEQKLGKAVNKRNNCSAQEIDGISNFWWKTLRSTWGKLATVMQS